MLSETIRFASDILTGQEPRWLFLCGESGTGKTHLAKRLARFMEEWGEWAYTKHGKPVPGPSNGELLKSWAYAQCAPVFCKWAQLIDAARDGHYAPFKTSTSDWFKVIDDVGAEGSGQDARPTAFVTNQLGKLCDARLGKWTVFTSNYGIGDFSELFDARISSRMLRDGNVTVDATGLLDFNLRRSAARHGDGAEI